MCSRKLLADGYRFQTIFLQQIHRHATIAGVISSFHYPRPVQVMNQQNTKH